LHYALWAVPSRIDWVLLAYRMPREPSTPRIAVWRKLRRLGVVQLVDGLVALPADARTKEQLEWLAEEVLDAGGEATVWVGQPGSAADERRLAARMAEAVAEEYQDVIGAAEQAARESSAAARRAGARLGRELQRIDRRDFFPPPERKRAHRAVRRLARTPASVAEVPR
jgi:ChrB-like protein